MRLGVAGCWAWSSPGCRFRLLGKGRKRACRDRSETSSLSTFRGLWRSSWEASPIVMPILVSGQEILAQTLGIHGGTSRRQNSPTDGSLGAIVQGFADLLIGKAAPMAAVQRRLRPHDVRDPIPKNVRLGNDSRAQRIMPMGQTSDLSDERGTEAMLGRFFRPRFPGRVGTGSGAAPRSGGWRDWWFAGSGPLGAVPGSRQLLQTSPAHGHRETPPS